MSVPNSEADRGGLWNAAVNDVVFVVSDHCGWVYLLELTQ